MKTLANAADRAELLARLRRVVPDSPRQWGRMSAHQMLCHLSDAFLLATGEKGASDATGLPQRTIIKWLALYAPMHWPHGVPTRPEIDQECDGVKPAEFDADRARVEALLERLPAPGVVVDGRRHPIFGALSRAAWLRWGYLHVDHHLRQFGE